MQYKSNLSNQHILIVDDDPIIRQTIRAILQQHQINHIYEADNATSVYQTLLDEEIDAILLDINMPNTDGIEICTQLRTKEKYNLIPIIFITSEKSHEVLNTSFNAGANDFIQKPVTELELITRLDSQLYQRGLEVDLIMRSRHNAQEELISLIAHHWRQPLMHISSLSSNIQTRLELDMFTKEDIQDTMKNVDATLKNLSELIDSFNLSLTDQTTKEVVTITSIIDSLLSLTRSYFETYHIYFNIKNTLESSFNIDHHALLQVLFSIVLNSIEALRADLITKPTIGLTVEYIENKLVITLEDNGKGIKKEDLDYIFEPYFSTKKELNGTGLGLYRSKQIIERNLNGSIEMSSNEHQTKTTIRLNIQPYAK